MFPNFTGCKVVNTNVKPVQAENANFTPYGSQIALHASGPAPIFKQQGSKYNTVAVKVNNMITTLAGATPGEHLYVSTPPPTDNFVMYAFDTKNPC